MAAPKWSQQDKAEWMNSRLNAERARMGPHTSKINALPRAPVFGPNGTLSNAINKTMQLVTDQVLASKAPKNAILHADIPSTCFSELSYSKKTGEATGTFVRDGSTYSWPCDTDTFAEWCQDSLGKFFNAEIRE